MLNDVARLYSENVVLFAGSVLVLGLVIGSFLNVVIYRLPIILQREWRGASCRIAPGRWLPNDGRRGRRGPFHPECSPLGLSGLQSADYRLAKHPDHQLAGPTGSLCGLQDQNSARYPLVELMTAVLSATVAWHFGFGPNAACAILVTWALIALTGIDIDHQLLPDNITLPLMWAGLAASVVIRPMSGEALPVSPRDALIGAMAGYLSLWLVFHAFRLATGKEGMGYGDFKLFAALGAWLGWENAATGHPVGRRHGAVLGISMILLRGRDRAAPMPLDPTWRWRGGSP